MKKQNPGTKKRMKVIVIIICAAAVIIGICFVKNFIESRTYDGSGMANDAAVLSIEYSEGPDEYGRALSVSLKDGNLNYSYVGGTEEESVRKSCAAENELYDALENVIREYNVRSWEDLPANEIEVLDASTSALKIEFADGGIVCLGDAYEMPDGAWKAVSKITDLMEEYIENSDK